MTVLFSLPTFLPRLPSPPASLLPIWRFPPLCSVVLLRNVPSVGGSTNYAQPGYTFHLKWLACRVRKLPTTVGNIWVFMCLDVSCQETSHPKNMTPQKLICLRGHDIHERAVPPGPGPSCTKPVYYSTFESRILCYISLTPPPPPPSLRPIRLGQKRKKKGIKHKVSLAHPTSEPILPTL